MDDPDTDRHSEQPGPTFEVSYETDPSDVLVAGFSSFGLAGLTAVDFVVDQLDLEETGHVTADQLPAITPFENGTPRNHTRFFSKGDFEATVLVGELFVPVFASGPFSEAIVDWIVEHDVDEIAVLAGIPVPHGPDAHRVFYVATEEYQERRLSDTDVPPMGTGFLDGVNAELMRRGIEAPLAVSVFATPVHEQTPDVEAAIRLVDVLSTVYDIEVDTEPLEAFAAEIQEYYTELSNRLQTTPERQIPEDRMYM